MGARLVKFPFETGENEQIEAIVKIPKEPRSIINGIVKNHKGEIVKDAVVRLFEMLSSPYDLKPLTHTFTDDCGQFLFGPLWPNKRYVIKIWVDDTKIRHLIINTDEEDGFKYNEENKFEEEFNEKFNEEYKTE